MMLLELKTKTPVLSHWGLDSVVAQGRIELPTQGFSESASHRINYRYQSDAPPRQDVAHNLCLKINMLGCASNWA